VEQGFLDRSAKSVTYEATYEAPASVGTNSAQHAA